MKIINIIIIYLLFFFGCTENELIKPKIKTVPEETEKIPPVFTGTKIKAVTIDESTISLSWDLATDNITTSENIVYKIYIAEKGTQLSFFFEPYMKVTGVLNCELTGLEANTEYTIVVFAADQFGNISETYLETIGITAIAPDITAPVFAGINSIEAVDSSTIRISWAPASDDMTLTENIQYKIYVALLSGQQNFNYSNYTTASGVLNYTINNLNELTYYYVVVRAIDTAGNIDNNRIELNVQTPVFVDLSAPEFPENYIGIYAANTINSTTIELIWLEATDNVTPDNLIEYQIFKSTSPITDFSNPTDTKIKSNLTYNPSNNTLSFTYDTLIEGTTYYFAVKAKDEAGNIDTNINTRSAIPSNDIGFIEININIEGGSIVPWNNTIKVYISGPSNYILTTSGETIIQPVYTGATEQLYTISCEGVIGYYVPYQTQINVGLGATIQTTCFYWDNTLIYQNFETDISSWQIATGAAAGIFTECLSGDGNCVKILPSDSSNSYKGINFSLYNLTPSNVSFYMNGTYDGSSSAWVKFSKAGQIGIGICCTAAWGGKGYFKTPDCSAASTTIENVECQYIHHPFDSSQEDHTPPPYFLHHIEIKDISFINHNFKLFIDGLSVGTYSFYNNINSFDFIGFDGESVTSGGFVLYDELILAGPLHQHF
ncbi:MAG: fibronectin type III domain-containing protein [Spirochaetia bacterium]|nr:fibronectin type III domain-containing protein [Spirochaetia bacterium]